MEFVIGRAPDSELVLNHACVSSRHASIARDARGVARLKDEHSANGTFVNDPANEIRAETDLHDDDVVFFSEEYKVPGSLLLKKFSAWEKDGMTRSALALGQVYRGEEDRVTLGSAVSNVVVLPYVDVWPEHAVISRQPDGRRILHDLGGGCMVNGQFLRGAAVALRPVDTIEMGGVLISTSFDPAGAAIIIGTERRGFYLTAQNLTLAIPTAQGERRLLDGVGFSILPGEFVGLLGPSGCGKTTLLTCLCGITRTRGVFYNGRPLAASSASNTIGYVPQDDVLYPELTVRETLYYSARLRLNARISSQRIYEKIDEVCGVLKLVDPEEKIDLRDTLIGSPERKILSGGQKKRVNLALALVTDPLVLLLDEPTSGLSSGDTRTVMESLRRLADEKGIPIIITIHQPSPRIYKTLDHALYLKNGRLAWFGPAYPDSVKMFVPDDTGIAAADEIMEAIDAADPEALRARYEHTRYAQKFVTQRAVLISSLTEGGDLAVPRPVRPLHLAGQMGLLFKRQLTRRWRDPVSLAIQLGQAPLLGLMVGIAFMRDLINSPLFLLAFIAIWFGANATARELVSERVIFTREKRGGVSPAATLTAKMASHGLVLLIQSMLLFLGAWVELKIDTPFLEATGLLFLCGTCGAALGYVISALVKTELAATVATPLVLIPLILFGGYLPLYDRMPNPIKMVSHLMPSRWGYEALVQAEKLNETPVHASEREELTSPNLFLEFSSGRPGASRREYRRMRVELCVGVLMAMTLALAVGAWRLLCRL